MEAPALPPGWQEQASAERARAGVRGATTVTDEAYRRIAAGRPWGASVGYSRAVRVGCVIEVAGTSATDENGGVLAPGDAYGQARITLSEVMAAIEALGGRATDVVRTRIFVVDMDDSDAVARAHIEVFAQVLPASTLVQVGSLMLPGLLVEIEATAVLHGDDRPVAQG